MTNPRVACTGFSRKVRKRAINVATSASARCPLARASAAILDLVSFGIGESGLSAKETVVCDAPNFFARSRIDKRSRPPSKAHHNFIGTTLFAPARSDCRVSTRYDTGLEPVPIKMRSLGMKAEAGAGQISIFQGDNRTPTAGADERRSFPTPTILAPSGTFPGLVSRRLECNRHIPRFRFPTP
jgi:hypothetical protein